MRGSGGVLWKCRDSDDPFDAVSLATHPGKMVVVKMCDTVCRLSGKMELVRGRHEIAKKWSDPPPSGFGAAGDCLIEGGRVLSENGGGDRLLGFDGGVLGNEVNASRKDGDRRFEETR